MNNIELVPTPTYASYLNRVECHFLPISEFVTSNADTASPPEMPLPVNTSETHH
jgi:hypothetical protein